MKNKKNKPTLLQTGALRIVILIIFTIAVSVSSSGQTGSNNKTAGSNALEGKTFVINLLTFNPNNTGKESSTQDEIIFVGGKFHSVKIGKEFNYTPDTYSCTADSSKGTGAISFVAFTRNEAGEVEIFWKGTITGNTIKGTMHWFSQGITKMFSGGLKYENKDK